jgi:hypothetical protein
LGSINFLGTAADNSDGGGEIAHRIAVVNWNGQAAARPCDIDGISLIDETRHPRDRGGDKRLAISLEELRHRTDNQLAISSVKEELELEELDISLKECRER